MSFLGAGKYFIRLPGDRNVGAPFPECLHKGVMILLSKSLAPTRPRATSHVPLDLVYVTMYNHPLVILGYAQ